MSALTKKALVASFIRILKEKQFEKINIKDITDDCGVARMTFYYHFQDIYDLLDYVMREKLRTSVSKTFTYETWQEDYVAVFEAVLKEKVFFLKIFNSIDLRRMEYYLSDFAHQCVYEMLDELTEMNGLVLNGKRREMVCDIYCYSMVGLLLNWISTGMKEEPRILVGRFCATIKGTLEIMLKNSAE